MEESEIFPQSSGSNCDVRSSPFYPFCTVVYCTLLRYEFHVCRICITGKTNTQTASLKGVEGLMSMKPPKNKCGRHYLFRRNYWDWDTFITGFYPSGVNPFV